MIAFVITAVVLVVVALCWTVWPLLRRRETDIGVAEATSNRAILADQHAELKRDLSDGTLTEQQYQEAVTELERRVLSEGQGDASARAVKPMGGLRTAMALLIIVPVSAVLLYLQLGNPQSLVTPTQSPEVTPEQVELMVKNLAARLEKTPDDGAGWAMLARSYLVMQRFDDATNAYAHAVSLIKDDAGILADYADALAMTQGHKLDGKPMQLVEQALAIDPTQWKALALAGSAAYDRKDYAKATEYWERLRDRPGLDPEFAKGLDADIADARQLAGMKPGAVAAAADMNPSAKATVNAGKSVAGTVTLSRELAAKAAPSDTVFIFARAVQGPPMPLAVVRREVKDLPLKFSLDDTQAMSPQAKLSDFPNVMVTARISKSGSALPQSGDLQAAGVQVKVGATGLKLTIDSVVP